MRHGVLPSWIPSFCQAPLPCSRSAHKRPCRQLFRPGQSAPRFFPQFSQKVHSNSKKMWYILVNGTPRPARRGTGTGGTTRGKGRSQWHGKKQIRKRARLRRSLQPRLPSRRPSRRQPSLRRLSRLPPPPKRRAPERMRRPLRKKTPGESPHRKRNPPHLSPQRRLYLRQQRHPFRCRRRRAPPKQKRPPLWGQRQFPRRRRPPPKQKQPPLW